MTRTNRSSSGAGRARPAATRARGELKTPPPKSSLENALLAQLGGVRRGPICSVGAALGALPSGDADVMRAWIAMGPEEARYLTNRQLIDVLAEASGRAIGLTQMGHHRRGNCGCSRRADGGA